ncbi:MAG: helix-turn-helix transcriptional regulator [Planctomycetes bacterium]|nr:helix-turn-helix transcriptional regulator [Planctomycetota bacterium]
MPKVRRPGSAFGERIVALRRARGLSQAQLAQKIGTTQRVISYYEVQSGFPSADSIVALAKALEVTTDELLGLKSLRRNGKRSQQEEWLWKKFRRILALPQRVQRTVLRMVNSAVSERGRSK